MRKVLMLFFIGIILTGCNIDTLDLKNIDEVVEKILKNNENLVNTVSVGYKYYLPKGVTIIDSSQYNEKLLYKDNYYYLYVDAVGYYHKEPVTFVKNESAYYSKDLTFNNKNGYIEISKEEDVYFVEVYYNYAKIEAYISEKNLEEGLINICYILNSITFNKSVIKLSIGSDELQFGQEKFVLFKPKREEGTFLDLVRHYDVFDEDIEEELNIIGNLGKENE